jgi:hypothetical protein
MAGQPFIAPDHAVELSIKSKEMLYTEQTTQT